MRPAAWLVLFLLLPASEALAKWGADINAGAGPRLIEDIAPVLATILKTPEASRAARIDAVVAQYGLDGIEAIKRFRSPELKPLFLKLAAHADWTVQHRALYALEQYGGADALGVALGLVGSPEVRLREKAVISCIKLWDGRKLPEVIQARLQEEADFHVRSCLDALVQRAAGKLDVLRVYEEHLETRPDGLRLTPFLSGMNTARTVAPGYKAKANARQGGGSAAKLPPVARWVRPLLKQGEEVVKGTSLQPFANLRSNGTVYHTGLDIGASLDGAGYYAPAEGIVKLIHSGSDMGTLIVVQHHLGGKQLVNTLYMHGGDTVFVKPGAKVRCGQLLGTMGMSYSLENGGHYAHLHLGMYPGAFSLTHNYGYRSVKAGLADWYDPKTFLAGWEARTAPLLPDLPPLQGPLARAEALLGKGDFGRAYAEVEKVGAAGGPQAGRLLAALKAAPKSALARIERLRADGYPQDALRRLGEYARTLLGIPGAEEVVAAHAAWKQDKALQAELKAEKALLAALKKAAKSKDAAARKALWSKLLEKHADTPVAQRIKARLEAK